jgi:hypothetical protein
LNIAGAAGGATFSSVEPADGEGSPSEANLNLSGAELVKRSIITAVTRPVIVFVNLEISMTLMYLVTRNVKQFTCHHVRKSPVYDEPF